MRAVIDIAYSPPDQPKRRPVIWMHLPVMGHVKHLRAPLQQHATQARDESGGGAECAVRFAPEFDLFHTKDLCRSRCLGFTNPDSLFS